MAAPADATKLPSGLAFRVLRPGTGTVIPKKTSRVTVHYTGWTTDGKMFDSSVMRGEPGDVPASTSVIKGWTEGVQLMVEGEKRRFWIPARTRLRQRARRARAACSSSTSSWSRSTNSRANEPCRRPTSSSSAAAAASVPAAFFIR